MASQRKKSVFGKGFIHVIERYLYYPLIAPVLFFFMELLVRKEKKLMVVGLPKGRVYSDNTRHFFEYCASKTSLKVFLITKNKSLADSLNQRFPGKVLYSFSLRGLWFYLKAEYAFVTHGKWDLYPYFPIGVKKTFINLWHGSPLKRVNHLNYRHKYRTNPVHFCRYHVTSSEFTTYLMATQWKVHIDDLWLCGQPRNDILFHPDAALAKKYPILGKKIILYAPTFRVHEAVHFFPFEDFDRDELMAFLEQEDAYILLRGHMLDKGEQKGSLEEALANRQRILSVDAETFPDIQDLLAFVDILITDYSSIYFDFLLLDRPVLFMPYDYESYNTNRGFTVDYFDNTPGPKIYNQQEFLQHLKNYFDDPTLDHEAREKIKEKYNYYCDDNSSKRILEKIMALR